MDNKRLLEFIRLIVQSDAGVGPLKELASILENQGEADDAKLVRQAINDYPEVKTAATDLRTLTGDQLDIAHRRATERRKREAEESRC